MEAVVGDEEVDIEKKEAEKLLCSFQNNISVGISGDFLGYRLLSGRRSTVTRSIMQLARFEASIATLLTCL